MQSVWAETGGSVSWARQRKLRWWPQQRCAVGWQSAAVLQQPGVGPGLAPVVVITDTGIKYHVNEQLIEERVYFISQLQRNKCPWWQEGVVTVSGIFSDHIFNHKHEAESKMEAGPSNGR